MFHYEITFSFHPFHFTLHSQILKFQSYFRFDCSKLFQFILHFFAVNIFLSAFGCTVLIFPFSIMAPPVEEVEAELASEQSFTDLADRIRTLNEDDKKRYMRRLTYLYGTGDVETPGKHPIAHIAENAESAALIDAQKINVTLDSDKKLPRFSGGKPQHGEVTFRKWFRCADRLLQDPNLSNDQIKKQIFRSLQGDAEEIAEINREKTGDELVDLLDKTYGSMVDGEELLIEFYQNLQTTKQPLASDYLNHLYIELGEVKKFNGISPELFDKTLLKQFNRGCTDEELILKLRLDEKINEPPTYPDLISSIRKEEAVRAGKKARRKTVARVQSCVEESPNAANSEVDQLKTRIAELELKGKEHEPLTPQPDVIQLQQRLSSLEDKFKQVKNNHIFCYRCGKDFHVATDCRNEPNKELVREKVELRKKRFSKK